MNLDDFDFDKCYEDVLPLFKRVNTNECFFVGGNLEQRITNRILKHLRRYDESIYATTALLATIKKVLISIYNREHEKALEI